MKNLLLLLVLIVFASCGSYHQATHVANQCYLGMSVQEFKKIAGKKASLESMENGYTVYRMKDYNWESGGVEDVKFFYFNSSGELTRIDGGVSRKSRSEIDININN